MRGTPVWRLNLVVHYKNKNKSLKRALQPNKQNYSSTVWVCLFLPAYWPEQEQQQKTKAMT